MNQIASSLVSVLLGCLLPAQEPAPPAIAWHTDLDATLAEAKRAGAPALVFFTASWCVPCRELKEQVCGSAAFTNAFAGWRCLLVDIDSPAGKAAKVAWEVGPIPDLRFVSEQGVELGGFVGSRSLEGVLEASKMAERSAVREQELRQRVANDGDASALLLLGELLLQRPTKRPGLEVLERAAAADPDNKASVLARVHWLAVGARMHPIGQPTGEVVVDAEHRLRQLEALAKSGSGRVREYLLAVRAWLQWNAVMRDWQAERLRARDKAMGQEPPLVVAADAPIRATLAALSELAVGNDPPDTAGDGILIDGLLHYYGGDYRQGTTLLAHFNAWFPAHRWHGEGVRFHGICERLDR
jgi:thiol-disulfide isomerase/thioredoxin